MDGPLRCDAAEITAVLAAIAQPQSRVVLDEELLPFPSHVGITTDQLWHLLLWRCPPGGAEKTLRVTTADGRRWERGCQRWWTTSFEVIEPLDGLTAEQRVALEQRLHKAVCWPETEQTMAPVMVLDDRVQEKKRPVRRARR